MQKRIFVRLDRPTLSQSFLSKIDTNPSLVSVEQDLSLYQFRFDDLDCDHALMLLSESNARFGYDLSLYLSTVKTFFQRTTSDNFVLMPESTPDFKRRYSEDLGVAIASLFLVNIQKVKWETIAQIPQNRNISKKTPDFMCLDDEDQRRLFEAKGTTGADRVDEIIRDAKDQLSAYPEQGVPKLSFATFISTDPKLLPSFCFVADPPMSTNLIDGSMLRKLHLEYVLLYVGLTETAEALRKLLSAEFAIAEEKSASFAPYRRRELSNSIFNVYEQEVKKLVRRQFRDREWVGQTLHASASKPLSVFLGVDAESLLRMLRFASILNPEKEEIGKAPILVENRSGEVERQSFSIFSDGTIYLLDPE